MTLIEVGPRFCLNPIKIFSDSFGGPICYENPFYISPNQANNAYIFPGLGLGLIMVGACPVLEDMLLAAYDAKTPSDKDFESDEAVWALYKRWCKAFNKKRDHAEMVHRFKIFKHHAEYVHHMNTYLPPDPKKAANYIKKRRKAKLLISKGQSISGFDEWHLPNELGQFSDGGDPDVYDYCKHLLPYIELRDPSTIGDVTAGKIPSDKDFESDEALWALYEHWCYAFNKKCDHAEMVRRFEIFERSARFVHHINTYLPPDPKEAAIFIQKRREAKLLISKGQSVSGFEKWHLPNELHQFADGGDPFIFDHYKHMLECC